MAPLWPVQSSPSQGSRNGSSSRQPCTQKQPHISPGFQLRSLSSKLRIILVSALLFLWQPWPRVGGCNQSPSRVQPKANKAHLTQPWSSSRSCSGCRDPMRQSSALACSPRDTEDMGGTSALGRAAGLHPHPACLGLLFLCQWLFPTTGTWQVPDSGRGMRSWLEL